MKKTIITMLTLSLMVAMFAAVSPVAAAPDAGNGPGNGGNGNGNAGAYATNALSAYMTDAVASVLGLDSVQVAASLESGETFYTIALAEGFTQDEFAALFAEARALALENAAADGVAVQVQTQLNANTNAAARSQFNNGNYGTCDGTGDCLQKGASQPTGAAKGRRGGR